MDTNKIIQISTHGETEGDWQTVFALTEKGEIWKLPISHRTQHDWEKLLPVPLHPVRSIAAPAGEALDTFYALIDPRDAGRRGLKVDAETSLWWLRQADAARSELGRAAIEGKPLADVLDVFANWFALADPGKVWCKGASFDFPMLTAAHEAVGRAVPWHFGRECCQRTMARLCPEIAAPRPAVAHHALEDAKAQAEHLLAIRRRIGHNG